MQYSVAARRGVISVADLNFQFSKPTFTLKVKAAAWKKKYKKAAEANRKKAGNEPSIRKGIGGALGLAAVLASGPPGG